jgi:hypothetical protein
LRPRTRAVVRPAIVHSRIRLRSTRAAKTWKTRRPVGEPVSIFSVSDLKLTLRCSYARQNQIKKGLWELDNILRSIYTLDFIDDPGLGQSVQKALNRGEVYHRMRRAISYVDSGKFRVKTEAEQQIWNECSRLIANAIIYYNTLLLSGYTSRSWQQATWKPSRSSKAPRLSPGATSI